MVVPFCAVLQRPAEFAASDVSAYCHNPADVHTLLTPTVVLAAASGGGSLASSAAGGGAAIVPGVVIKKVR